METKEIRDGMLRDAHSLLDSAEKLIERCNRLEKEKDELKQENKKLTKIIEDASFCEGSWIEYNEDYPDHIPLDGEFVVVQVGNCQPYMLTYLKGCKIKINKWFRLPEW